MHNVFSCAYVHSFIEEGGSGKEWQNWKRFKRPESLDLVDKETHTQCSKIDGSESALFFYNVKKIGQLHKFKKLNYETMIDITKPL